MAKRVKKDFDKEKMYRKIMPTLPGVEPTPKDPDSQPPDQPPPPPPKGPELHNYMEDMVRDKLEHTIKVLEVCDCDRCRMDICALALNQLPPAYAVVEDDGSRYIKKLKGSYEVKVTSCLIKAIQEVKRNPRH